MLTDTDKMADLAFKSAACEILNAILCPREGCSYGHIRRPEDVPQKFLAHVLELKNRGKVLSETERRAAVDWVGAHFEEGPKRAAAVVFVKRAAHPSCFPRLVA